MTSKPQLVQVLIALLAVSGWSPRAVDAWDGWITFKRYVRTIDDVPDPGIAVQVLRHGDDTTSLVLLRQVLEQRNDWLRPVGGVVMEFNYESENAAEAEWEIWSFDHETLESFVDCVEQHAEFGRLVVRRPLWSDVYWLDA